MTSRTLDDVNVAGQRVLLRADLNVPVQDGKVTDATRLERLLPTIKELSDKGAKVIVLSHFDRPKGKVVPEMSLRPIAEALGRRARQAGRPSRRTASARRPRTPSAACMTAMCWCWKTPASMPAKRRTTRPSPRSSPSWAISM